MSLQSDRQEVELLRALLFRIVSDQGGELILGELTVDLEGRNSVIVNFEGGFVTLTAVPDYVDIPDPEPVVAQGSGVGPYKFEFDTDPLPGSYVPPKSNVWEKYLAGLGKQSTFVGGGPSSNKIGNVADGGGYVMSFDVAEKLYESLKKSMSDSPLYGSIGKKPLSDKAKKK